MTPETTIENILEGKRINVFVTLKTADGIANVDDFDVYGAATDGRNNSSFEVTPTGEPGQYLVTIPGLKIERSFSHRYQICARRRSDGVEWVIKHGEIVLRERIAGIDDTNLYPPEIHVDCMLEPNSIVVTVENMGGARGERGYSAYEIACQNGFEGTEEEWLESMRQQTATLAVEQVQPLMVCAENAAASAEESAIQADQRATDALTQAEAATANATNAEQSAVLAEERANKAQAQAEAAIASAEVADEKARTAETSATDAFASATQAQQAATNAAKSEQTATKRATEAEGHAVQAAINATDAAQSARDAAAEYERAVQMSQSAAGSAAEAQESAISAVSAKVAAAESATQATSSAQQAVNSASTATTAATQAAESAAKLEILEPYAQAEGRNLTITADGTIATQIGHTYIVTTKSMPAIVTNADGYQLCTVEEFAQMGFVATSTSTNISTSDCYVTELFRVATAVKLSGGGDNDLPTGYKRVEYLESSGNQFIATNFILDSDCEIFCDFQPLGNNTAQIPWAWDNVRARCIGIVRYGAYLNYDWSNSRVGNNTHNLERHNVLISSKGAWLDGVQKYSFPSYAPFSTDSGFYVFRGTGYHGYRFIGRIYAIRVQKASRIVFDMVPCLNDTGSPCYFDKVSQTAFYNLMTGDFTYPTESTTYALRRVVPDWGKLTPHGLRRLYHAPADWQGELLDYALEHGYKPIIEPEMPEDGYWAPQWRETEEEIILDWVETAAPEQPTHEA